MRGVHVFSLTIVLLAAGCGSGHTRSSRTKVDRAAAAFGHLVRHRYGNENGEWACKAIIYPPHQLACWAEVHRGERYRGVYARTPAPPAAPTFSHLSSRTWTRRWRPLPFRLVHSFDSHVRASAWANAPVDATDWSFLIGGAYDAFLRHALPSSERASDGPSDLPDFAIRFRCVLTDADIVCTNGVGDALRLRPSGARFRRCGRSLVITSNYDCVAARAVERAFRRRPSPSLTVESNRMYIHVRCAAKRRLIACRSIYADGLVVTFPR